MLTGTRGTAARTVFAVTALISAVTIAIEFVYTAFGLYADSEPSVVTRLIRWISYFTNCSNILVVASLVMLLRDLTRLDLVFRVVRLLGLVGITVTFVVYMIALRPSQHLDGIHVWTNAGYHIAVPILTVLGWVLFGPWPRFDRGVVGRSLSLIAVWVGWTLAHGAVTGWYPYAIIDVTALGYGTVLRTAAVLLVLIAATALLFTWLDGVLGRRAARRGAAPAAARPESV